MLPALDGLALARPEVLRQRQRAGVQQLAIIQRLVVLVILGGQSQRAGFHAHVDVLRHQDHFALGMSLAQRMHHSQDLVVGFALGQARGQVAFQRLGLEEQKATRTMVTSGRELEALGHVATLLSHEGVKRAAGLAPVAGHFGHALLVTVELFKHDHRQEDVVFLEAEQAHRIMQQHVGVQHEEPCRPGTRFACRAPAAAGRSGDLRCDRVSGRLSGRHYGGRGGPFQ